MNFVEPIRNRKDIESMKKYLQGNKRDSLLFALGINTAYRVSDLLDLKFKDLVDDKMKPLDHVELKETKTGKNNKMAITKGVKKSITEYLEDYYKGSLDDYVFYSRKGINQPIKRQQAYRIINDAAKILNLKNVGCHSMRKTFAYHQYQAGTDITLLQDMLNHSESRVTLRYIGITQDEKDRAVLGLDL